MINNVVEFNANATEIKRIVREYGVTTEPSAKAVKVLLAFLSTPEDEREWILCAIPAFVCRECGRPSCLHGYSDE